MCNGVAIPPGLKGVGNAHYTSLGTSKALTDTPDEGDVLPANANYALLDANTSSVYISFDGDDATSADFELPVDTPFWIENGRTLLTQMRVIQKSASAQLSVAYFYGPQG